MRITYSKLNSVCAHSVRAPGPAQPAPLSVAPQCRMQNVCSSSTYDSELIDIIFNAHTSVLVSKINLLHN